MNTETREATLEVLRQIPKRAWDAFLDAPEGQDIAMRIDTVRAALKEAGQTPKGAPPRPVEEVLDLFGHRLLSDDNIGPWVRRQLLMQLSEPRWEALVATYRALASASAPQVHGNAQQAKSGSQVLAQHWHQGGRWAHAFCEAVGLPEELAARRPKVLLDDEEVLAVEPLPVLHDFQVDVYDRLRELLANGVGKAGLLSLPTGAGKTRVAVEALCDHLAESAAARKGRDVVLWIAQSEELLLQAWESVRQVWQVPPLRGAREPVRRPGALRIVRAWGARKADDIELPEGRCVVIAGIQQLASWVRNEQDMEAMFPRRRLAAVVVDEAHRILNDEHRHVLVALGQRAQHAWRPLAGSVPLVGLSATPWRTKDEESHSLRQYFQNTLLTPEALGHRPIHTLQHRKILARVDAESLHLEDAPELSAKQAEHLRTFAKLPEDYLEALGRVPARTAKILERLAKLDADRRALVFCCSIAHAEVMTLALNRMCGANVAALVTGATPRAERYSVVERFRAGELRFLCNVNVLTTGFDAPRADVVCVTRPTFSAIAYEQMVGRGLRGPLNGGTERCLVIDVQDQGLPLEVMSYGRVLKLWDKA